MAVFLQVFKFKILIHVYYTEASLKIILPKKFRNSLLFLQNSLHPSLVPYTKREKCQ